MKCPWPDPRETGWTDRVGHVNHWLIPRHKLLTPAISIDGSGSQSGGRTAIVSPYWSVTSREASTPAGVLMTYVRGTRSSVQTGPPRVSIPSNR